MKSINIFLKSSNIVELNSVEMNEITGGGWLSRVWNEIKESILEFFDVDRPGPVTVE